MSNILGLVEGFYGTPWNQVDRFTVLRHTAKWGYTHYFYGPKDDPFHRKNWRKPYPENKSEDIIALHRYCTELNLEFVYTIAPGLDFKYSNNDDFELMCSKISHFHQRGIKHFGLIFDDIPPMLVHPDDKDVFSTLGEAQNKTLLRFRNFCRNLEPDSQLFTCPTEYSGRGDSPYIIDFCRDLPQDLKVFWTGRDICASDLSGPDTVYFTEKTGHKPLYWDNYPVNDSVMHREMHLGPYNRRDISILKESEGLVLNPMEYPLASLIPLKTSADFFLLQDQYDPYISWQAAIEEVLPSDLSEAFKEFASYCFKSCLHPYFSNRLFLKEVQKTHNTPDWDFFQFSEQFLIRQRKAYKILISNQDTPLIQEIMPWLKKMKLFIGYYSHYVALKKGGIFKIYHSLMKSWYRFRFQADPHDLFQLELLDQISEH